MDIEGLKQALEAATPGPWRVAGPSGFVENSSSDVATICQFWSRYELDYDNWQANARLIVAAVNNLPALLKVAEAAKDLPYLYDQASADPYNVGYSQVSDEIELLRKALEELSND